MGAKSHLGLAALAGGNLLAGLLWQVILYAGLGPGASTDALVAGAVLPQTLVNLFGVALTSVLIPLFSGEARERQNADAWGCLALCGGVCAAAALGLWLAAPWWTGLLFPGFDPPTARLCVQLARVQALLLPLQILSQALTALHYARDQFLRVEFATLAVILPCLGLLHLLLPGQGVAAAAWLGVARAAALLALLLAPLGRPCLPRADLAATLWSRARPILAGNAYFKTDGLLDRYLLSMSAAGHISLFDLAQQMVAAGAGLLGKVFGGTALSGLAVQAKQGRTAGFAGLYRRRLAALLGFSGLAYVLLLPAGQPLLRLAAGWGRLGGAEIHTLWLFLLLLGGVLVFGSAGSILSGAFYALGDTRTPSLVGAACFSLCIAAKVAGFFALGAEGVCLAASAYYCLSALVQWLLLERRLRRGGRP